MGRLSFTLQPARNRATSFLAEHSDLAIDRRVDVRGLAGRIGIEITDEQFSDPSVAGFLLMKTKAGHPTIVVNETNSEERKRFTIAHELGHYFLHASQTVHIDDLNTAELSDVESVFYRNDVSSQATQLSEIEANQFAAELLMPTEKISEDIQMLRANKLGLSEAVIDLAQRYQVSQAAMAIRLARVA